MTVRWPPRVGQRVYDTRVDEGALVADILRRGLPRPVYVLRAPHGSTAQPWETDQPLRLLPTGNDR